MEDMFKALSQKCPHCGKTIPINAIACPHCKNYLDQVTVLGLKVSNIAMCGYWSAGICYCFAFILAVVWFASERLDEPGTLFFIGGAMSFFLIGMIINLLSALVHRADFRLQLELKKHAVPLEPVVTENNPDSGTASTT